MDRFLEMIGQASNEPIHQLTDEMYGGRLEESMYSPSVSLRRKMYYEALKPFSTRNGTKYSCSQNDIDFHRHSHFTLRGCTGDMTDNTLTTELILQNQTDKAVQPAERGAIGRLQRIFEDIKHSGTYGPDLAIKAFNDLDLVFFGGYLRGRVRVRWSTCSTDSDLQNRTVPRDSHSCPYGFARKGRFLQRGEVHIVLNAGLIFFMEYSPLELMVSTLLHEMCHAVEYVKCRYPYPPWKGSHDEHFETRISSVHERAMRILGLGAIGEWEGFMQRHWLGDSYRERGYWRSCTAAVELDGREVPAELE